MSESRESPNASLSESLSARHLSDRLAPQGPLTPMGGVAASPDSRVLLRDGQNMPWVGLGVWQTPADETAKIVEMAVSLGYRAVDTATLYRNEEGVGDGLRETPEIFVTTKLWNDDQGFDRTLRAFEKSCRLLQRECLDLYLIHWPMPDQNLYVESWKALIRLRDEGRVRSIGVSNFMEPHLERLMEETGEVPAVNQIEIHPRFQQKALRAFNERHGIQTESWRPLGKGEVLSDPVICAIASRLKRTPAQIALRWHLQNRLVVIPKSVHRERLRQNLDLFGFSLTEADMTAIAALDRADGRMGEDPLTVRAFNVSP